MNCIEFQRDLEEAVLSRVTVSSEVQGHGRCCTQPDCRAAWADYALLSRAIPDWQVQDTVLVVPNLTQPTATPSAPIPVRPKPAASNGSLTGWLALAAASVAMLSLVSVLPQSAPPPDQLAETPSVRHTPVLPAEPVPEEHIQELSETYVEWIQGSTGQLTDTLVSVLIEGPSDMPQPKPVWLEHLEDSWEPVGDSLQESLQGLWPSAPVDMENAS